MEITKLTPRGFCKGVVNAIHIINKALENNTYKNLSTCLETLFTIKML